MSPQSAVMAIKGFVGTLAFISDPVHGVQDTNELSSSTVNRGFSSFMRFNVPSYLLIFRKRVRSHVNSEMSLVLRTIHYILELQPGDHSSEKSLNLVG